MRTLFKNPIRKDTTLEFYPEKINLQDFKEIIVSSFSEFEQNMKNLGNIALQDKYVEEWIEEYLAWLDIEEDMGSFL